MNENLSRPGIDAAGRLERDARESRRSNAVAYRVFGARSSSSAVDERARGRGMARRSSRAATRSNNLSSHVLTRSYRRFAGMPTIRRRLNDATFTHPFRFQHLVKIGDPFQLMADERFSLFFTLAECSVCFFLDAIDDIDALSRPRSPSRRPQFADPRPPSRPPSRRSSCSTSLGDACTPFGRDASRRCARARDGRRARRAGFRVVLIIIARTRRGARGRRDATSRPRRRRARRARTRRAAAVS